MKRQHVEIVAATERDPIKAAALLIFTKATRLAMDGAALADVEAKCIADPDWMNEELSYMAKTIRSSWEFLDITFSLRDVSRACAQQITRTRFTPIDGDLFGSYAMQSQRVTDMSKATWHNPMFGRGDVDAELDYDERMQLGVDEYRKSVEGGMPLEDARGLLPVNLHCNLIAKYNLRILVDLIQARSSYRAQGEFNVLAQEMREALVEMWPWAEMFLRPKDELASDAYADVLLQVNELEASVDGDGRGSENFHPLRIALAKLNDIVQGGK
jgi:flavin-dependent thymidylate synthase